MRWSISVGRLFGIPVRLHITLLILLVAVGLATMETVGGAGIGGVVTLAVLTSLVAVSVLAHELGHALVAARSGLATREIVLHALGGHTVPPSSAVEPRVELRIALAGPAVSLVTGGALLGLYFGVSGTLLFQLALFNLVLGVLNLLPALPLDGGRALRAGLTIWMGVPRATRVVARLGRFFALCLVAAAFFLPVWAVALASGGVFLFFAASVEERSSMVLGFIKGKVARDVSSVAEPVLQSTDTPEKAAAIFLAKPELRALLVTFGDRALGVLHRAPVLEAVTGGSPGAMLHRFLDRNIVTTGPETPLSELLMAMHRVQSRAAVLVDGGPAAAPVGLVLLDAVVARVNAGRELEF